MSFQIREQIVKMFASLHLSSIDPIKIDQMAKYASLLLEGLEKIRLTGEKSPEGIIWQQIYDSIYILKLIELRSGLKVVDLGSGGGLPGLPLKICRPEIEIYLLDANRKKAGFLSAVKENLGLDQTYILCGRAEEYGQDKEHREGYDLVLSKAVAEMAVLAEMALPLLKTGGRVLLYKGPKGIEEAREAEKAIKLCGGNLVGKREYYLESGEIRLLYEIIKISSSPLKYPRRTGVPERRPIK